MRRLHLLTALLIVGVAASAHAQSGRAVGVVRDTDGRPIRGAIVRATNPTAHPSEITSATDNKGRWAMIGLGSGQWQFVAEAPGFIPQNAAAPVRVAGGPPLMFTLARDPGPIPDALDKNIQQQLTEANMLRDQGRFDQAIAAYQEIRTKNPKLTSVTLVMGDTYRRKAAQEANPAAQKRLLDLAIESYTDYLKTDGQNERAKAALDSTRTEASGLVTRGN